MKRFIIVGLLLLAFALAVAPSTSATAYDTDDRDIISFVDGTFDINVFGVTYGIVEGPIWIESMDMPALLGYYDWINSWVGIYADGPDMVYDLVVNGVPVVIGQLLLSGNTDYWTFDDAFMAGVDPGDDYLSIEFTCSEITWEIGLNWEGDDCPIIPEFFNEYITITEEDVGTPNVGGVWVVQDSFTNDQLGYGFFDCTFVIDYPNECAADSPDTTPWSGADFYDSDVLSVQYQKFGPAADEEDIDFEAGYGTVTLTFDSDDELDDAEWDLDIDDLYWDGAFTGIDFTTLSIEINDDDLDEDDFEEGSLVMENIDIENGENEVEITWTTAAAPSDTVTPETYMPTEEAVTLDTEYGGVPLWAIIAIGAVIVIAAIAIIKIEKK